MLGRVRPLAVVLELLATTVAPRYAVGGWEPRGADGADWRGTVRGPSRVDGPTTRMAMAGVALPVLATLGGAMPARTGPALPTLTVTGAESPDALRAAVRETGLAGRATIDAVVPAGSAPDGRKAFVLGMWINMGAGTPLRVDNAPTAVEDRFVHKVTVGATVPVRVALVGSAQATVLLWDEA